MTSLAEAYEENVGEVGNVRLLYLGVGLFAVGTLLVVLGIVVSTTSVESLVGFEWWEGRELAGVSAGLGVPAVFVGIFAVLPASQRVRAAAAIGAGISVLGVALFTYAYPYKWTGAPGPVDHTLPVLTVYSFGVLITFGCLFVAVANFKTRNDPGGTVTLEISREGEVRTVEVERDELADVEGIEDLRALEAELDDADGGGSGSAAADTGLGGVAFVGETPDGETPTQTNQPGRDSPSGPGSAARSGSAPSSGPSSGQGTFGGTPTSDGGTTTDDIQSPLDGASGGGPQHQTTDAYCGNCQYFEYVRTNEGMAPRCGYYNRTMDDMEACEEWEPNR